MEPETKQDISDVTAQDIDDVTTKDIDDVTTQDIDDVMDCLRPRWSAPNSASYPSKPEPENKTYMTSMQNMTSQKINVWREQVM